MNALYKKLGIQENQVIQATITKRGTKETNDTPFLLKVRQLMHNTFLAHTDMVSSAEYMDKKYKRDDNNRIVLDKDKNKVIDGYITKGLTGQFLVEDNKDGTHTLSRFNVYKDTYLVCSNTLSIAKVTNGVKKESN